MRLDGTETISIELGGALDAGATQALAKNLPAPLVIERDGASKGRVSVLVLEMHRLGLRDVPLLPRFDYREVLYRLGATIAGEPAWLALRCDLDRAAIRAMAARTIRYPVQSAHIEIEDAGEGVVRTRASTTNDSFGATLRQGGEDAAAPVPPRRTFVAQNGRLFEVPWAERAAPSRHRAVVADVDAASCRSVYGADLDLDTEALVHRGRTHYCGSAQPVG